jgi:hypothetical protein
LSNENVGASIPTEEVIQELGRKRNSEKIFHPGPKQG